jgi:hypothetical protein
MKKTCSKCKRSLRSGSFNVDGRSKDGLKAWCRQCHRQNSRDVRARDVPAANARHADWRKSDPKRYILWRAGQNARRAGLEFALTADDLTLPTHCPVLGLELHYPGSRNDQQAASLDRVDSTKGYVAGNVAVVSWRANTLKNSATAAEMCQLADFYAGRSVFPPKQADGTINPKDAAAMARVPMHLLPPVGAIYGAMACRDGAVKYGSFNWRERAISLTQYIGAMQRHLLSLLDGEDCASDSKLPHLAHVIATAAILLDAQAAGALLDDRPKRSGNAAGLITKLNAELKAKAAK